MSKTKLKQYLKNIDWEMTIYAILAIPFAIFLMMTITPDLFDGILK